MPPAIVSLPLAILFLWQVLQIDTRQWLYLAIIGTLTFTSAALWIAYQLSPELNALDHGDGGDRGAILSQCLQKTLDSSLLGWGLAAIVFAVLSTTFVQRSWIGFSYFLVAAAGAAGPSICWSYGAGKAILLRESFRVGTVSYRGREISLARKMAIVFIGFFILSSLALILLVSSRVSTALEKLAIASSSQWFERSYQRATVAAAVDSAELAKVKGDLPDGYSAYRFLPDGTVIAPTGETPAFDQLELRHILTIQNGDSATYVAPHVMSFRQLPDGTVFAVSTPWSPYANIPRQIAFYTLIIALLTTAIFSVATYFLSREISSPLKQLRRMATAMADGDFTVQPRIFTDDEMGMLAASFGTTRDNLRLLLGRIGGGGTTITEGVRVMTAGTENLLLRAREQTSLTKTSSAAVLNVRASTESVLHAAETVTDLSVDASSRATELLASAEEVGRSMDYLFQSVEKSSSSTTQMDAAAREMSKRTEVLANIGEEVLSFVVEMDATVAELRKTAHQTADLSRKVREEANEGDSAVQKTVEGIQEARSSTLNTAKVVEELQRSVGQISQIVSVIEEITDRTNLLALNAAIIAAQAGEQGAGFTVVADEIRELAERTRGQTKEISGIVKGIQRVSREAVGAMHDGVEQVTQSANLAKNAAWSLQKIQTSAAESYEMANNISSALEEQSAASSHLHEQTSRMSDHISEINRSTREQARGTMMLAQETERVHEIAAQVRRSTDEQTVAARGITNAMEQVAADVRTIRDLLQSQLQETERIASAADVMLNIADANDSVAQEFSRAIQNLVRSGNEFETEVARFRKSNS